MVSGDRSSSRAVTTAAMALELLEDGRESARALLRVVWSSDVRLMIGCNCYRVQIKQMKLERVPEFASCLREVLAFFFRRPRQDDNGGGEQPRTRHGDGSCRGGGRTRTAQLGCSGGCLGIGGEPTNANSVWRPDVRRCGR